MGRRRPWEVDDKLWELLEPLLPQHAAVPEKGGRTRIDDRQAPGAVYVDRGCDYDMYRRTLQEGRITPVIARRGHVHGSGLGVFRWVIERSLGWLHWPRRLRIR